MKRRIPRWSMGLFAALLFIGTSPGVIAQEDLDPNSPTPILISESKSTRALAFPEGVKLTQFSRSGGQAFQAGSRVILFATNLEFAGDEGANSLRLIAQDSKGRLFRLPVISANLFQGEAGTTGIYAITVEIADAGKFLDLSAVNGDVLIGLTWRGLISNRTRFGINQTGGELRDDPGAVPTPFGNTRSTRSIKALSKPDSPEAVGYKWSGDRRRFLEQATFGPTAALDERIRRIGLRTWLAEQFDAPYPSIGNPYPNNPLKPNPGQDPLCDGGADDVPTTCVRDSYTMYLPQTWFMREAFYGDAQLKHRVSWALAQIWVTSGVDVTQSRHMVEYHKVLSKHAFGNYRALMKEMTLHPTMGDYLSMSLSTRTNPNENYAREIMQLFSIGLFMLNQDGTLQLDNEGNPIPTYTQDGVNNLTEVLTGWSFCNVPASCPNLTAGVVDFVDPMLLNGGVTNPNNNRHDLTTKTLLTYPGAANVNIPACPTSGTGNCTATGGTTNAQALANIATYANTSLDQALDNLFNHPNVGPFVSKILIQHMVTSDPTPAYVGRVASVFNNNGLGVRGDMKAVVKAILLDPEARGDVKTDPSFGKLREPVQLVTNFARAFGVRSAAGTGQSDGYFTGRNEFNSMAQVPFMSPTVFNFYPPDYVIPGSSDLGPEFAIMNTGTTIARANFMNQMVFVTTPIAVSANAPSGTSFDFSDLQALAAADSTGNLLLDELNRRLLHSTMTDQMRNTIRPAITAVTGTDATSNLNRARQAIYLVATSSQYQVQR